MPNGSTSLVCRISRATATTTATTKAATAADVRRVAVDGVVEGQERELVVLVALEEVEHRRRRANQHQKGEEKEHLRDKVLPAELHLDFKKSKFIPIKKKRKYEHETKYIRDNAYTWQVKPRVRNLLDQSSRKIMSIIANNVYYHGIHFLCDERELLLPRRPCRFFGRVAGPSVGELVPRVVDSGHKLPEAHLECVRGGGVDV